MHSKVLGMCVPRFTRFALVNCCIFVIISIIGLVVREMCSARFPVEEYVQCCCDLSIFLIDKRPVRYMQINFPVSRGG